MSSDVLPGKTRSDLGWDQLLVELAKRARTDRGGSLARRLALLDTAEAATTRMAEIREARHLRDRGEPLPLDGVRDLDGVLERAEKSGVLLGDALCDVASTLRVVGEAQAHLRRSTKLTPRLTARAALLDPLENLRAAIDDAFEGSGNSPSGSTPRLADHASRELGSLRRRALATREELEKKLERLLDSSSLSEHLQDRFYTQRDERYVVPIRIESRHKVPGIVHGVSSSGQTFFVEPEDVVGLNNRLRLAELEVAQEERRILAELSLLVEKSLTELRANLIIMGDLDLIDAGARLAIDLRAHECDIALGSGIDLRRARHPLLVLSLGARQNECIPNDLVVADGRALIVSGPNAGGKTVALKTAGLVCLMARAGLHIPAQEGSRVPFVTRVLSDIGDDQSLEQNLSTFSAHVESMQRFCGDAAPGALLLVDEIAVGTDPDQGAALAQALLENFVTSGATVIVTTHYERLKALAVHDNRFFNASVGFDMERLAPTYELHLGIPGASGAVMVARRLGLDEEVCARTTELLAGERLGLEELLIQIERDRQRMQDERNLAESERREAERLRALAEQRLEEAKVKLEQARRGEHDEAIAILRSARAELDAARLHLKQKPAATHAEVVDARRDLDELAQKVTAAAPARTAPPGRAARLDELRIGLTVWVARLAGKATVTALPRGSGDKVAVAAGPLRLTVPLDELRVVSASAGANNTAEPDGGRPRKAYKYDALSSAPAPARRDGRPEIDLRGERSDVALGLCEKFLDDLLRNGESEALIIHGLGTGALRDRLRAELAHFPGVVRLRAGQPREGGDGVTILELS